MKSNLFASSNPSRAARRAQVRRLRVRHKLSMSQIARQLGVSKPTVMRDLRWWQEQPPEEAPADELAGVNRQIEDAIEEAWYAYSRSQAKEIEAETVSLPPKGGPSHVVKKEATAGKRTVKPVRAGGSGNWRYLSLIGRLIEWQVKLLQSEKVADHHPSHCGPSVVLYQPDKSSGSKNGSSSLSESEAVEEREARKTKCEMKVSGACRCDSHCGSSLSDPASGREASRSERAAAPSVMSVDYGMMRNDNGMIRNVTICNGSEAVKFHNSPVKPQVSAVDSESRLKNNVLRLFHHQEPRNQGPVTALQSSITNY